ncbi:MAG: ubiquinone biosynthesis protein UbiE [Bdellovibrionales bacterium RBG_16_40_8]|nr:MAG: ubiquinone biosynthesis protein UbiE [Bdellovibrionales bacterium RBG_16_40_8]
MNSPNAEYIKNLFGSISGTYDRANDVITLGLVRLWRKKLVQISGVKTGQSVLDCATGTGDLALEFKKVVGESGRVVGTDFCEEMLALAPEKAKRQGLDVTFAVADVLALPYADKEFAVTSIAYGIRNVSDPILALREMARVTKSGGAVMILETGESKTPVINKFINLYFSQVVPRLGGLVSGKRSAYNYLQNSSRTFPSGDEFLTLMRSTGAYSHCECHTLMGGASYIYKGTP